MDENRNCLKLRWKSSIDRVVLIYCRSFRGLQFSNLTWHERWACWRCVAFCCIDSINNKSFLSYTFIFRNQFYFVFFGSKINDDGNPNNNLESPCRISTKFVERFVEYKTKSIYDPSQSLLSNRLVENRNSMTLFDGSLSSRTSTKIFEEFCGVWISPFMTLSKSGWL
jgi:hypothetical protein